MYAAWGSHGLWLSKGEHAYGQVGAESLVDHCSDEGEAWDTWNLMENFGYYVQEGTDAPHGRGLGGSTWPAWMRDDYATPPRMP